MVDQSLFKTQKTTRPNAPAGQMGLAASDVPLKVLYVLPPSPHFAGMERVVHEVASGLATRYRGQIDVSVLYCYRYPELQGDLPYRPIWEDAQQLRAFPFRVARWLRKESYDVIDVAQFEPTVLVWLCNRLWGGRARFVMHFHGNPKIEGTGSRRARIAFTLFNTLVPRMDKVVAVSPSLTRYIENRVGKRGWVDFLPNPVRQFDDVTRQPGRSGVVSSVGRLARQKGFDILIEALGKVVASGLDARLTIVGDGSEHEALAAQIARLGLGDRVRLAGYIASPSRELAEADCFVSASRWEGFGVAIVEAMSAGLYVIATDCEFGPSDLIDSPEKGQIVPSEDVDALASAMATFVRAGDAEAGDRARREAAAVFSLDHVVQQHAAMLRATAGRAS
jgi:glycosyltransferase involved in cell wall biosynthesis